MCVSHFRFYLNFRRQWLPRGKRQISLIITHASTFPQNFIPATVFFFCVPTLQPCHLKPMMYHSRRGMLRLFLCMVCFLSLASKCLFVRAAQVQMRGPVADKLKETREDADVIKTPKNKKKERPPKRRKQKPRKEDRDHEF